MKTGFIDHATSEIKQEARIKIAVALIAQAQLNPHITEPSSLNLKGFTASQGGYMWSLGNGLNTP
jgi:hypothetical protein